MNWATKVHPMAGHGNGSVLTHHQPSWSPPSSSLQRSSSSRSSSSAMPIVPRSRCSSTPAQYAPMDGHRDVALVLSGGGMNATLIETGFLQRLRDEPPFWSRVGWIYGTSAGALTGTMAAADRLDELEEFLLALRPEDAFRPHRLWQLPLTGLHDYTLPQTIAERVEPLEA